MDEGKFVVEFIKRKKKERRNSFIKLGSVVFLIFLMFLYFVTPVSKVRTPDVKGNRHIANEDIRAIMKASSSDSLFNINASKAEELLNAHSLIENASVFVTPFSVKITLDEITPVVKYYDNEAGKMLKYLSDGSLITDDILADNALHSYISDYLTEIPELFIEDGYALRDKNNIPALKTLLNLTDTTKSMVKYIGLSSDFVFHIYFLETKSNYYYDLLLKMDDVDKFISEEKLKIISQEVMTYDSQKIAGELVSKVVLGQNLNVFELKTNGNKVIHENWKETVWEKKK